MKRGGWRRGETHGRALAMALALLPLGTGGCASLAGEVDVPLPDATTDGTTFPHLDAGIDASDATTAADTGQDGGSPCARLLACCASLVALPQSGCISISESATECAEVLTELQEKGYCVALPKDAGHEASIDGGHDSGAHDSGHDSAPADAHQQRHG